MARARRDAIGEKTLSSLSASSALDNDDFGSAVYNPFRRPITSLDPATRSKREQASLMHSNYDDHEYYRVRRGPRYSPVRRRYRSSPVRRRPSYSPIQRRPTYSPVRSRPIVSPYLEVPQEISREMRRRDRERRRQHDSDLASLVADDDNGPPSKQILVRPPEYLAPEGPAPVREGVAPLEDPSKRDIPPNARWTKLDRKLVTPEALDLGNERYSERADYLIVLRVLTKEEIEQYALKTQELWNKKVSKPPGEQDDDQKPMEGGGLEEEDRAFRGVRSTFSQTRNTKESFEWISKKSEEKENEPDLDLDLVSHNIRDYPTWLSGIHPRGEGEKEEEQTGGEAAEAGRSAEAEKATKTKDRTHEVASSNEEGPSKEDVDSNITGEKGSSEGGSVKSQELGRLSPHRDPCIEPNDITIMPRTKHSRVDEKGPGQQDLCLDYLPPTAPDVEHQSGIQNNASDLPVLEEPMHFQQSIPHYRSRRVRFDKASVGGALRNSITQTLQRLTMGRIKAVKRRKESHSIGVAAAQGSRAPGVVPLNKAKRASRAFVIEYHGKRQIAEATELNNERANSKSSRSGIRDQSPTLYETQTRFLQFSRPVRDLETTVKSTNSEKEEGSDHIGCISDKIYSHLNTEQSINGSNTSGLRLIYVEDDRSTFYRLTTKFGMQFPRARSDFRDWGLRGSSAVRLQQPSTEQTSFWRPSYDPLRQVVRAAFGLEYLTFSRPSDEVFNPHGLRDSDSQDHRSKVPKSSLQRLSVCVQRRRQVPRQSRYKDPEPKGTTAAAFDGATTLLIFDSAQDPSNSEPLLPSVGHLRNLTNEFAFDELTSSVAIIRSALIVIFEAIAVKWSDYIFGMHNYVSALENQIYTDPANDTRATSVWSISKRLLQAERLLKFHILLLEDVQSDLLPSLDPDYDEDDWLRPNLQDFHRLASEVEETLKKPVAQMVDLMYKSISIRDARQSLELNTSLWRLSWITFIFLPLTFLCGFFGMNVSLFETYTDVKWYFIVGVPLMALVLLAWLSAKGFMRKPLDKKFLYMGDSKVGETQNLL